MIPKKVFLSKTDAQVFKFKSEVIYRNEYISIEHLKEWAKNQPKQYASTVNRAVVTDAMNDLIKFIENQP